MVEKALIVAIVSAGCGVLLLLASALFLAQTVDYYETDGNEEYKEIISKQKEKLGFCEFVAKSTEEEEKRCESMTKAVDKAECLFYADHHKEVTKCERYTYWLAAGSFGIIACLVQIGSVVLGFLKKWKLWCILHLVVFIVALIAFALAVQNDVNYGFRDRSTDTYDGQVQSEKQKKIFSKVDDENNVKKFFVAWSGFDFVFAYGAAIALYFVTK